MRIENQLVHQEREKNADRLVEIKDPAPGVVDGDPSAQSRSENRRQQNSDAKCRHGMAMPLLGKGFQKNRLSKRLQSGACKPLQHAKHDQLRERSGESATQRPCSEAGNAGQQQSLPAHMVGWPSGIGNTIAFETRYEEGFLLRKCLAAVTPARQLFREGK